MAINVAIAVLVEINIYKQTDRKATDKAGLYNIQGSNCRIAMVSLQIT